MSNIIITSDIFSMIDQAGSIDAEIKALEKQLATLKTALKTMENGKHSGFVFSATVVPVKATTKTDWATIAARFNPSHQLISAHTTTVAATKRIIFSKD
jgi:hypothetical protein